MIVQGELAPGVKLNERVLCERLRTSRTPVREAIKYLASEGLVELLPNRGAIVTPITAATVREMFELLGALEALAGELACAKASDADIADIRALHYQMLAHHARGELAPYFRCNQEIHMRLSKAAATSPWLTPTRPERPCATRALHGQSLARALGSRGGGTPGNTGGAHPARQRVLPALLRSHLSNKMAVVLEALAQQAGSAV